MTTEQIKDCEDTVMEVIKASKPIFEKEMSLPVAQKIEGLRAVFGGVSVCLSLVFDLGEGCL